MMPKITDIFIDLDGTLLNDQKEIDSLAKQVIPQLLDISINIWLCSGRPHYFVEDIKKQIDNRVQIISFNGAMINNHKLGHFSFLTIKQIKKSFSEAIVIYKSQKVLYSNKLPISPSFGYPAFKISQLPVNDLVSDQILKIIIIATQKSNIKTQQTLASMSEVEVVSYPQFGYELSPKDISKGKAVNQLRNRDSYFIGIGNDINDSSLFKACDYKVAMKNSDIMIQALADEIILSNNQQGVGLFLQKILERRKENETY